MKQDIDGALRGWDFKPGVIQARMLQAGGGRQVIQLRVDLGVLQMETAGRPDGAKPHGFDNYFEYLQQQANLAVRAGQPFTLTEEQCQEADREFVQFYQRRVCWMALRNFERAVTDADHTLAFMEFVSKHSPSEEYTQAHEQYRGFVLFHRVQAAAALAVEKNAPEKAIDELNTGLKQLRDFFSANEAEEQFEDNPMVQQLHKMQDSIRQTHGVEETLLEQLEKAVANEEYEIAAKLRDALKRRT